MTPTPPSHHLISKTMKTMTRQEYNQHEGINYSLLKKFAISPAYYQWYLSQPKTEPSSEMKIGLATHTLSLTPELFIQEYAVAPKVDRRTKEGKEVWNDFVAASGGKTVLTEEEFDTARRCTAAWVESSLYKIHVLGKDTLIEKAFFGKHISPSGSVVTKGIPDIFIPDKGIIIDLKTFGETPTPEKMRYAALRSEYLGQAAYYKKLVEDNGFKFNAFIFAFIEKAEPNSINFLSPLDSTLIQAQDKLNVLLERFINCKAADIYPSTDNGTIHTI